MFPKCSPMFTAPQKNNIFRNIVPVPVPQNKTFFRNTCSCSCPQNTFQEYCSCSRSPKNFSGTHVPVPVPVPQKTFQEHMFLFLFSLGDMGTCSPPFREHVSLNKREKVSNIFLRRNTNLERNDMLTHAVILITFRSLS